MKKIVIMMVIALMSVNAFAQTKKGDSSFGLTLGGGFGDINHVTLGIDYRYNITNEIRLTPSITHFIKNDHLSAWAIDANAHYVFKLSDYFGFYPLAGMNFSFWKASVGKLSHDETRIGANIGLGGELYASKELSIGLELKYLIIADVDQPMVGIRVGYNF